jgi:hypothetical protein
MKSSKKIKQRASWAQIHQSSLILRQRHAPDEAQNPYYFTLFPNKNSSSRQLLRLRNQD